MTVGRGGGESADSADGCCPRLQLMSVLVAGSGECGGDGGGGHSQHSARVNPQADHHTTPHPPRAAIPARPVPLCLSLASTHRSLPLCWPGLGGASERVL